MPDTSLPLTQEEHEHMARELRANESRLRELCDLAVSVYGTNHRVSFSFQKLLDASARLRADLLTQWSREYPGNDRDCPYQ